MGEFIDEYEKALAELPELKFEVVFDQSGNEVRKVVDDPENAKQTILPQTNDDLSPTAVLDNLVIAEVKECFQGLRVPDPDEFVYNFCNKYTMFKGSVVKERLEKLSERGWK